MTQAHPQSMLVALDLDGRSDEALRAAAAMSERFSASLHPVHVVEVPPIEDVSGRPDQVAEMYAKIEAGVGGRMRENVAKVLGSPSAAEEHVEVLLGHAARALIKRAEEVEADWIFLGHHEHHQLFDFGSTTRAVLAKASGGVWNQAGPWRPIERILVPVDLSEGSMQALASACEIAKALGASLTVLHCFQDPDFAYIASPGYVGAAPLYSVESACTAAEKNFGSTMEEYAWSDVEHEVRFVRGRPVESILDNQDNHQLIVMGSHGRTGLSSAVLGNVAYGVLKKSTIPVLALKGAGAKQLA